MKLSDFEHTLKRAFDRKLCLYVGNSGDECQGDIVKAHTVQRAALTRIAEDGHVYGFAPDFSLLREGAAKDQVLRPRKIGIRKASTFTGFCQRHDNDLFHTVEDEGFEYCEEHAFLLGYRSLCREIFAKMAAQDSYSFLRTMDSGCALPGQVAIQRLTQTVLAGTQAGLSDMGRIKREYDKILAVRSYERIGFYAVSFDRCPSVLCSGGFWPEFDFDAKMIQRAVKPNAEGMQFSITATPTGGAAVFTWLKENGVSEKFVESLAMIPDSRLPDRLLTFAFEYFENTYLGITWGDALPDDEKTKLRQRMAMEGSLFNEHHQDCLLDDHMRSAEWRVVTRVSNLRV